jgi:type IV secretion system protein VirD4
MFKDGWETITGDCATLVYLGGNELSTHEYISKMLGKETLDTRTYGTSKGRTGSSSTNYQNAGRELLTSDEVRTLDPRDALIFVQGERPVRDRKYDLLRHPMLKLTADGKAAPFVHVPERLREPQPSFTRETKDFVFESEDFAVYIPERYHKYDTARGADPRAA